MRTKFKAWHKAEKVMCEVSLINIESGAFLIGVKPGKDQIYDDQIVIAPDNGRFCEWDEIEMLEYTGLKDKNGKEVFESDIVYWPHLDQWGVVYYNEEEVHYFSKPLQADSEDIESYLDSTHMEVKGNIHATPNLLE